MLPYRIVRLGQNYVIVLVNVNYYVVFVVIVHIVVDVHTVLVGCISSSFLLGFRVNKGSVNGRLGLRQWV